MSSGRDQIFVAGATGFVGREVVRLGRERGLGVIAHVRPDSARLADWRERFEALGAQLDATPWDQAAMTATFESVDFDAVFCLIGTTRSRGRRAARRGDAPETHESVDYGLTALLVDAVIAAEARPRFVYLSSMGADGKARGSYMRARQRAEQHVQDSGLTYTIVRPAFIVGPGRDENRWSERLGAAVLDGALAGLWLLGGRRLRQRYQSITNVELAGHLLDVALDERLANEVVEADRMRA